MTQMLDAALTYAAMGIPVFPLLPKRKEPATKHGSKDATTDEAAIREAWTAYPDCNIGGRMGDGLVCLDFDVDESFDSRDFLVDWEREHGHLPETATAVTGRGGMHMFYHVDREVRNSVNSECHIDVRGQGGYAMLAPSVHPNGNSVYWDFDPEDVGIADADETVYAFIEAVKPAQAVRERPTAHNVQQGEGRNNYLYKLGCSLRGQGLGDEAVKAALESTNIETCKPPLGAAELRKIVRSVCALPVGMSDEAKAAQAASKSIDGNDRQAKKKFDHEEIARRLMDERGACFIDGMPAVKENGRYRLGWDSVDKAIIDMQRGTTRNNRAEVKALLQLDAPTLKQSRPTLIAFTNGVLDVETMELRDYQPADVIPNVVPHKLVPTARSADLERMLERIACGDIGTMLNLTEFMGLCIARSSRRWPFFPVLTGEGSNGKSTYIRLLRDMAGAENVSGLQPSDITEKYNAAMLLGKTANLGDDISGGHLDKKDCSVIKKVATGDLLYTDVKYGVGFAFEPYATMVFSCNVFPTLGDTSYGMMRRLFPVEFRAKFSVNDPEYDPTIGEKLATEDVLEAACVLAVEGLRRVIAQGEPTRTEAVDFLLGNIKRDSDTVSAWVYQRGLTVEDFLGRSLESVFSDYASWCDANGYRKFMRGSSSLSAQIGTFFGISLTGYAREVRNGESKRVRVYELKEGNDTKTT